MLNGGLWRVRFSVTRKLLKMERETGFEPATSSLGSWHSTTELLPRSCVFRYLAVRQGVSRFRDLSIPSRKSIQTMGSDRKMDSKTQAETIARTLPPPQVLVRPYLPSHNIINIS